MKKRIICAVLCALVLTACNETAVEEIPQTEQTTTSYEVTATTTALTVTEETVTTEEAAEAVTEPPEEELKYGELVEVSPNNRFIDFEYIHDCQGIEVSEFIAEKAVEYVRQNIGADDNADLRLYGAYPDDYDGDGFDEAYFIVTETVSEYRLVNYLLYTDYYSYENGGDDFIVAREFYGPTLSAGLLDYGSFKHFILGVSGSCGAETGSAICSGGKCLYWGSNVSYVKTNCFLGAYGWQSSGGTMYYDTEAKEYRYIVGVPQDYDDLFAMDSTGVIKEYAEQYSDFYENPDFYKATLIGNKYYCLYCDFMDPGMVYTYENGEFKLFDKGSDTAIRYTWESEYSDLNMVKNIDIDKAYAEMLTPEEAKQAALDEYYSQFPTVSEGNVFIDFDYIKEYSGSEDKDEAVTEAAVQCLKESEYYSESLKNKELILADKEKHKDDKFADYYDHSRFYNENGELVPIVTDYFPEDYDGDGDMEYFVLVRIPQYLTSPEYSYVRDYLIYVRKETADTYSTEIMGDYTHIDQLSLLDYGAFKQLIIGGYGLMGADDHEQIFGVINGKAECLYGFRGGFVKTGCFLGSDGWQGMGETMYYDTVKHCYQTIGYVEIPKAKVLEMDSTGIIRDTYGLSEDQPGSDGRFLPWYPVLIGNKYYCITHGPMDGGVVYVYENGGFRLFGERGETAIRYSVESGVIDIDMEKALEEMLTPEEAKQAGIIS